MSDENIIDVDQNETDTCEEITDTNTISGEDKSENISTNEAAGTTEDIDADYSIDEEPGESSENTSCSEANEATTVSGATASQVAETAGSKRWNEYTSSTDLDDTDELMILDTSAKANKRTLLSKLADYVLGKLADKVFAKLETQNQTVIGALNELNSKPIVKHGLINNIECPANTITTVPLVYDTPFPRYPIIIPCFRSSTTMIEYGAMQIFVDADGYEKSGCNLKIANNSKYNLKPSINWIAASYQ